MMNSSNTNQPPLLALLEGAAINRGNDVTQMCAALHVTVGFYRQMETGSRPLSAVSSDLIKAMADYLHVAPDLVSRLAGLDN